MASKQDQLLLDQDLQRGERARSANAAMVQRRSPEGEEAEATYSSAQAWI